MEKSLIIFICGLNLFISSSSCCLVPGSCEHGPPYSFMGRQRLLYGGRMALVESDLGATPPPWANQRLFIFRMPISFFKRRHHHSLFGHKGIISITSNDVPCGDHISVKNDCLLTTTTQDSGSFCLDSTLPCYKTPPSYNQSEPLSFSYITPTSITVTWPPWDEDIDVGNGPIVGYKIEIRKVGEAVFTKVFKGMQFSHQFDNLEENTDYEFRVTVIRDHPSGEGTPSNTQICATSTNEPPQFNNPEPLVIHDVTSSSATISWPRWDPKVDNGTGPVTGYQLLYHVLGRRKWEKIVVRDLSIQLTGLLQHSTYEVAMKLVYGNESYSPRTSKQTFTTKCRELDDLGLTLSSMSTLRGEARISAQWSFNVIDSCNVVQQTLTIQQLDSDACRNLSSSPIEVSLANEARTHTERNLEVYSNYSVTITTTNLANDISYQSETIRTEQSKPTGRPLNVRRKEFRGRGRVLFSWDEPACGTRRGQINMYRYRLHNKNKDITYTGTTPNDRQGFPLVIGDKFTFRVAAATVRGRGPWKFLSGTFGQG